MTNSEKAAQIQRDFNVPHPLLRYAAGIARKSDAEVTPFTVRVAIDRVTELWQRGFPMEDAYIVLLMRGARREALAAAAGYRMKDIGEFVADIKARLRQLNEANLDEMYGEALRNIDLMGRA